MIAVGEDGLTAKLPVGSQVVEREEVCVGLVNPDVGHTVAVEVAAERDGVDTAGVIAVGEDGLAARLPIGSQVVQRERSVLG